jgi:carbamoylphosphate synthase large subunit
MRTCRIDELDEVQADLIVLLSHHSTLLRDASLAGLPRIVGQPESVARLAQDKRAMGQLAAEITGCWAIPELTLAEARSLVGCGQPVVCKRNGDTEGRHLRILGTADDAKRQTRDDELLQPFLDGVEYSVNLVCLNNTCLSFEPVYKGPTSRDAIHPSRRLRYCPWPGLAPCWRERMLDVAGRYAQAMGARGLVEIEFILTAKDLYFLEVNPRLSGTMRMTSIACGESLFAELALRALGRASHSAAIAATRFTAELPLTADVDVAVLESLAQTMPLWLSSRVTTAAADFASLQRQVHQLGACLGYQTREQTACA